MYTFTPVNFSEDGDVTMADLIIALKVIVGLETDAFVSEAMDVNADNKVGLEEVIYILQIVSELR